MDAGERGELEAALVLAGWTGIGPLRFRRLVERFGSAEAACRAGPAAWGSDGAGAARAAEPSSRETVAATLAAVEAGEIWAVPLGHPGYPGLLARIPDPPPVLFGQGTLPDGSVPAVAVVGSRRASPYGLRQAGRFGQALAARGVTVTSGGARGVDAEAHRAALRVGGRTVAVLGSGHRRPYPPEHRELFAAIVEAGGAVVGEFPPWIEARPEHFPRRNRIVSGLSVGVAVIEATRTSGAMITARLAVDDHDRHAWAVPGRIDEANASGTNHAIRAGWAACATAPEDILEDLSFAGPLLTGAGVGVGAGGGGGLDPDAAELLGRLRREGEIPLERLDEDGSGRAIACLTILELAGLARRAEGVAFALS